MSKEQPERLILQNAAHGLASSRSMWIIMIRNGAFPLAMTVNCSKN